jgi:hypothetical protein
VTWPAGPFSALVARLLSEGRKAGVRVLVIVQRPMPRSWTAWCAVRVSFSVGPGAGAALAAGADVHDCGDFEYQEDAQDVYDADPSDPNRLDADDDGLACETLPRPRTRARPCRRRDRGGGARGRGARAKAPAAHYGEQAEQLERGHVVPVQGGEVAEWV